MQVELILASAVGARRQLLELPPGTTVAAALAASRFAAEAPAALAIYGERVAPGRVLVHGDRVELRRELPADPDPARRRRAAGRDRARLRDGN